MDQLEIASSIYGIMLQKVWERVGYSTEEADATFDSTTFRVAGEHAVRAAENLVKAFEALQE